MPDTDDFIEDLADPEAGPEVAAPAEEAAAVEEADADGDLSEEDQLTIAEEILRIGTWGVFASRARLRAQCNARAHSTGRTPGLSARRGWAWWPKAALPTWRSASGD